MALSVREAQIARDSLLEVTAEGVDSLGHITAVTDDGTAIVEWFGEDNPGTETWLVGELSTTTSGRHVMDRYLKAKPGAVTFARNTEEPLLLDYWAIVKEVTDRAGYIDYVPRDAVGVAFPHGEGDLTVWFGKNWTEVKHDLQDLLTKVKELADKEDERLAANATAAAE